jgi:hypothetical protein
MERTALGMEEGLRAAMPRLDRVLTEQQSVSTLRWPLVTIEGKTVVLELPP